MIKKRTDLTNLQMFVLGVLIYDLNNYASGSFVCRTCNFKYGIYAPSLQQPSNMFRGLLAREAVVRHPETGYYRVAKDYTEYFRKNPVVWKELKEQIVKEDIYAKQMVIKFPTIEFYYKVKLLAKKAGMTPHRFVMEILNEQLNT